MDTPRAAHIASARPVIGDIAEKSGVSATTVSRVLNGHPDVSPATRQKVLQYARELGYVSNRPTRPTQQGLVGLTVPMFNAFFGKIMEGAYEALSERNAQFIVTPTNNAYEQEVHHVQHMLQQEVLGVLFILPQESPAELLELQARGVPFVVTDPQKFIPNEIPVVAVENISAGKMATEHLLKLGHRRIGLVTGPYSWSTTTDRLAGYYAALGSYGIAPQPNLILEGHWMTEGGYEAGKALLALPEPPTAIFAFNDGMALGVLHAAWEAGLKVPEDLSVIGFDDAPDEDWRYLNPPLTTIHQPLREVGRIAVDVLYRIMQNQPLESTHIKLSTRLIARASTGPCKER